MVQPYRNNSLYLARKYARIFDHGYLFREANSELRGTDNVQGQILEHIFKPNGGFCISAWIFVFLMFAPKFRVELAAYGSQFHHGVARYF